LNLSPFGMGEPQLFAPQLENSISHHFVQCFFIS
jgi:hypothetical protein